MAGFRSGDYKLINNTMLNRKGDLSIQHKKTDYAKTGFRIDKFISGSGEGMSVQPQAHVININKCNR